MSATKYFGFLLLTRSVTHFSPCYRSFQSVVYNSGQKRALRAFYFTRALTKAIIYYYINRPQRHLLVAIEKNIEGPIDNKFIFWVFCAENKSLSDCLTKKNQPISFIHDIFHFVTRAAEDVRQLDVVHFLQIKR